MGYKISGANAESLIRKNIADHQASITNQLTPFNAASAVAAWSETLRAIEEFINLPLFGLNDDKLKRQIVCLRLDHLDAGALAPIQTALIKKFSKGVANRFVMTVLQSAAIGHSFRLHGMTEAGAGLLTVEHAIGYFQSRRRHLVSLLYTLPVACKGSIKLERMDTLNQFLPILEHSALTLTGNHQMLMLSKVFADFELTVDARGFYANHQYNMLDGLFLEPERAGIVEMTDTIIDHADTGLERLDPRRIFSAAEVRNSIRLMELAYQEFDLANSDFAPIASFLRECLRYCEDQYWVRLTPNQFREIADQVGLTPGLRQRLVHRGGDYLANLDVYSPFLDLGSSYMSTVMLVTRFLYYWRTVCLNRLRRFQIRAGFILENSVKAALADQGFEITAVKRINSKEFDVVATLNGTIYNVQCKNNLVDLSRIESDATRFARYNRQLEGRYVRALIKEEEREGLLKEELGLSTVKHFVVSRFPVATRNPRIIPFSQIGMFKSLATR